MQHVDLEFVAVAIDAWGFDEPTIHLMAGGDGRPYKTIERGAVEAAVLAIFKDVGITDEEVMTISDGIRLLVAKSARL